MKYLFNDKIENFLKIILKNALNEDLRVFFVGGIVRDKILEIPTFDIDLLILGNAIEFSKSLPDNIKIKSIHEDFCTLKLEFQNIEIDIASSRTEKFPYSGCLPVLENIGVSLCEDVLRRDFSINSLYWERKLVENQIQYHFIDMVDGLNDIKNKTLKVLHDKSYFDDPTRIIRGLGFKYRFGFDFSEHDICLIENYMQNIDYSNMSIDRNIKVIKKVLNSKNQTEIFKELVEKKYYKIINPNNLNVNFDLIDEIFETLKLDMVLMSDLYLKILLDEDVQKYNLVNLIEIYKTFSKMTLVDLAYYFYKTLDYNVIKYFEIKDITLNISGSDLLKAGYQQGLIIGKILDDLLVEKLNNPNSFKDKKSEMAWVLKSFHKN